MQVSSLPNGSIQFSHNSRQLEVASPSSALAEFFGKKGSVECHSQVNGVAKQSLRVSGNLFLDQWIADGESRRVVGSEEFESENSTSSKQVIAAELTKPGLLQVTYGDQSKEQLFMGGHELYRLVKAASRRESFFLYRLGSGEWIRFSQDVRVTDAHGDAIGRFQLWSPALRNVPVIAESVAHGISLGVFRCQIVRSLEIEPLSGRAKPTISLFRYFIDSSFKDGGSPVSVVQIGTLDEAMKAVASAYGRGLMLIPTPQLGSLVGLQLSQKETVWRFPPDSQLRRALTSIGARCEEEKRSRPREVILVLEEDSSRIEVRNRKEGSIVAHSRLSRELFLQLSTGKGGRLFKRIATGCAPIRWDQFQVALAKSDPELSHIARLRIAGLVHSGLVKLEATDALCGKRFIAIQLQDFFRLVENFNQPDIDPFYLPFWQGSERLESTHWLCFEKEMRFCNRFGQEIMPLSWSRNLQEIYNQSSFDLGAIKKLSIENGRARLTVVHQRRECDLYLNPDALFRNLVAVRDGRSVVIRANMGEWYEGLRVTLRLKPDSYDFETIDRLLTPLLPYVSPKIAQLPRGVFGRTAFPVSRVKVEERVGGYRFWFHGVGTTVGGEEVSIKSSIEGSVDELVQMVTRGFQQQRMLLDAGLPTGDRVYLEVDKRTTSWELPEGSPFGALKEIVKV